MLKREIEKLRKEAEIRDEKWERKREEKREYL